MGTPLMIQEDDARRILALKKRLNIRTKIDVIRAGMALLEEAAARQDKIKRWQHAAARVAKNSAAVNKEFQSESLFRKKDV